MWRSLVALALVVPLASCAPTRDWVRSGVDEARNQRDYEACRQRAYIGGQKRFSEETFPPRPGGETERGANPIPAPMDRYGMSIGSDAGSLHRLEWQAARDRAHIRQQRAFADCLAAAGFESIPAPR